VNQTLVSTAGGLRREKKPFYTLMIKKTLLIDFEPVGRRIQVATGTHLLAAAQAAGVQLASVCGGIGSCDSCKIRLVRGSLSRPTLEEQAALSEAELKAGFRLACQSIPLTDVKVDIPPESLTAPQRLQVEGVELEITVSPAVQPVDVVVEAATLEDLRGDDARLAAALQAAGRQGVHIPYAVIQSLPEILRANAWQARLALDGSLAISVLPPGNALLGVAVDVGTTKMAAYLVELASGKTLTKAGIMNPQVAFGEDVVSRIAYANQGLAQRRLLHERIVTALNDLIADLCAQASLRRDQIVEAVVVGNTAMHHFFLDLPVQQLGAAPYVPALSGAIKLQASEIGLQLAGGAQLFVPPNIAGYVGADHVSMLLATDVWQAPGNILALDIGTNTEISLVSGGEIFSCSTASGPVFEGAYIRDGMRAAPGAIERVQIVGDTLRIQTIENLAPVGICGSGILDAIAEMLKAGILDRSGRMLAGHPLVGQVDSTLAMQLADEDSSGHGRRVLVNRKDVHEIQLAKGAIRAGTQILLTEAGLQDQDLDRIVIAGAFGTYIHIPSAIQVGMLPELPLERFEQVGNAAGVGARQMLISRERRGLATDICRKVHYIELTTHADFTERFMEAIYFNPSRGEER
jgi:uncharacterized 2Fe-2S/4Fe-4S cluster protein (DUF4445 family)